MQTQKQRTTAQKTRSRRTTHRKRSSGTGSRDIVYTAPKPFNRNRFLLRLATAAAIVLALILGMSIFFKVENVYVSGANKYTAWQVKEASGIKDGENLLTISRARIAGRIQTELPYADDVRVGIKLPNSVNIEIVELDVVYAIEASDGTWWLMGADGKVVDTTSAVSALGYTKITGVKIAQPELGMTAVAAEPEPEQQDTQPQDDASQVDGEQNTQPLIAPVITVTGAQRLDNALQILQALESNGVVGQAGSLDVTDVTDMRMEYGLHYQIQLGDSSRMEYKIQLMKAAIDQMGPYQSGILDVSFTTWPNEVGYTPFAS